MLDNRGMNLVMDGKTISPWGAGLDRMQAAPEEIKASVSFVPDSPWFAGHFPDDPVLPGIAQIGMVYDAILKASGKDLRVTGLSRVKFKKLVRPGDILIVQATPAPTKQDSYSFRITVEAQEVCVGIMKVNKRDK